MTPPHCMAHYWWYQRLKDAGVVPKGTTRGERMHKAPTPPGSASSTPPRGTSRRCRSYSGTRRSSPPAMCMRTGDIEQLAASLARELSNRRRMNEAVLQIGC